MVHHAKLGTHIFGDRFDRCGIRLWRNRRHGKLYRTGIVFRVPGAIRHQLDYSAGSPAGCLAPDGFDQADHLMRLGGVFSLPSLAFARTVIAVICERIRCEFLYGWGALLDFRALIVVRHRALVAWRGSSLKITQALVGVRTKHMMCATCLCRHHKSVAGPRTGKGDNWHPPSLELPLQCADRNSERLCRMRAIAMMLLERLFDSRPLQVL
jgi:hypothetical protein